MEITRTLEPVNGLHLLVHRFRDPTVPQTGMTVLLVHGFADAGSTWDMVAEPLALAGHDVVAPDLRGFGGSDQVGAGGYYHFPDYVADVAFLVDLLAPARLAVVGHSMGGTVSCLYTGAYPDRVERLAILEGVGTIATEPEVALDRMRTWIRDLGKVERVSRPLGSFEDAVDRLAANHPRVPRAVLESRTRQLSRMDSDGRARWTYDPLHRTRSPTAFQVETFKAFLRQITCPTLFVSGGPTGWHPPDEAERVALIPNARTAELPNAGHMMHWTAPAELAKLLIEHLR
jgi:pimeloyl-ACP methyl ester carboxylesterase